MKALLPFLKKAWRYFVRASALRCPLCGVSPIFPPLRQTRSLYDWFTPLDGCPRCGYAYEREPGYFLLSIWAVNYGISALLALILYFATSALFQLSPGHQVIAVAIPVALFSLLFARHSKAYFIAFDHLCDPAANSNKKAPHSGGA